MGWVEPHGAGYRARWRVGGEVVSVQCETKTQAQDVLDEVARERRRGRDVDPRGGRMLVKEWGEEWIETRPHVKKSTDSTDRGRMRNHIVGRLGTLTLAQVTPIVVRRWITALEDDAELAPKTIRNCHGLLHSLMAAAVEEGLIPANPCENTKLPEAENAEMHFLTAQEVYRLVHAHPEHYRPLIVTLAGTGMRWGEAAGLRRRRLDIMGRRLEVVHTLEEVDGTLSVGTPKTRRSRRIISLPDAVVDVLVPLSLGDPDGYLFTTPAGARLRRHNFGRRVWKPAVAKAKLPDTLRIHDLRHTHVAHLIAEGVHPASISRRLGHKSIRVTMDVYGHLLPDVDDGVLKAANRALKPLGAPILLPAPDDDSTLEPQK